jgi:DnaJ-class molecular chaperone
MEERIRQALDTMGLPTMITKEDLKRRYLKLAKENHPDIPGADGDRMREIIEAYELLREYMEGYRFSFDSEEISRRYPDESHAERFGF